MTIDKQALRQLAEKASGGEWWSDVVETDGEYGDGEDRGPDTTHTRFTSIASHCSI